MRAQCDDSRGRSLKGGSAEGYPGTARLVVVVPFNTLGGDEESSPRLPGLLGPADRSNIVGGTKVDIATSGSLSLSRAPRGELSVGYPTKFHSLLRAPTLISLVFYLPRSSRREN